MIPDEQTHRHAAEQIAEVAIKLASMAVSSRRHLSQTP